MLNQAFYMTHKFDSDVSLHYWMIWPSRAMRPHHAIPVALSQARPELTHSMGLTLYTTDYYYHPVCVRGGYYRTGYGVII